MRISYFLSRLMKSENSNYFPINFPEMSIISHLRGVSLVFKKNQFYDQRLSNKYPSAVEREERQGGRIQEEYLCERCIYNRLMLVFHTVYHDAHITRERNVTAATVSTLHTRAHRLLSFPLFSTPAFAQKTNRAEVRQGGMRKPMIHSVTGVQILLYTYI